MDYLLSREKLAAVEQSLQARSISVDRTSTDDLHFLLRKDDTISSDLTTGVDGTTQFL